MRIATLNLNGRAGASKAKQLQQQYPNAFDVLALQEASAMRSVHEFAKQLGMCVAVSRLADFKLNNVLLVRDGFQSECDTWSWDLDVSIENRSAVALTLAGTIFVCTHLDAYDEEVRVRQLCLLKSHLADTWDCSEAHIFLLGDFNALRQADYCSAEWNELLCSRASAGISSETEVTDLMASWGWIDCRSVASTLEGPTSTHLHGSRVDYMWATDMALSRWNVKQALHLPLPTTLSDHYLVVYEVEELGNGAPLEIPDKLTGLSTLALQPSPLYDTQRKARALFQRYDADGDGILSHQELQNLLICSKLLVSEADWESALKALDAADCGFIEIDVFSSWAMSWPLLDTESQTSPHWPDSGETL